MENENASTRYAHSFSILHFPFERCGSVQSDFLSKWLTHYDPIHLGWTPRGIANAVCATSGWSFPRVGGGYNLYRGSPTETQINYADPVGAAGPHARSVANFAWRPHTAATEYWYALKAIGGGGVESGPSSPPVRVAFDGLGALIGARSNSPSGLSAQPAAEGRFVLRWSYSPLGEAAVPLEFRVYSDGGSGVVNYSVPVGTVPYKFHQTHFTLTTDVHAHGARRRWAVRAVSGEGEHDGNTASVVAFADASGPVPHPYLLGECLEED